MAIKNYSSFGAQKDASEVQIIPSCEKLYIFCHFSPTVKSDIYRGKKNPNPKLLH